MRGVESGVRNDVIVLCWFGCREPCKSYQEGPAIGDVGCVFVIEIYKVDVDVGAHAGAGLGANNPVTRVVKAIVLVANSVLARIPLVLICVPHGLFGSDVVKMGPPLLLLLLYCRCGYFCSCGCDGC